MKEIPFSTVLSALEDDARVFPVKYVGRFSDLSQANLEVVMGVWPRLPQARKHLLLKRMLELFDEDTVVSFEALAGRLLDDPDGQARVYEIGRAHV